MWIIKNKYGQYYAGFDSWVFKRSDAKRYASYNLAATIALHLLEDCTIESA